VDPRSCGEAGQCPRRRKDANDSSARPSTKKSAGTDLTIRRLGSDESTTIPFVKTFTTDSLSRVVVYAVEDSTGRGNGLFLRRLEQRLGPEEVIAQGKASAFRASSGQQHGVPGLCGCGA